MDILFKISFYNWVLIISGIFVFLFGCEQESKKNTQTVIKFFLIGIGLYLIGYALIASGIRLTSIMGE